MLSNEEKDALRQKGGRVICEREDDDGNVIDFVFRKPTDPEWDMFVAHSSNDRKSKHKTVKRLVQDCLLHPSHDVLESYLDVNPPAAEGFSADILEVCGLSDRQAPKKL